MTVVLLVGIPVVAHALVTVTRFLAISKEIARGEGQTARLREPSVDAESFNPYMLDLWERLRGGEPIQGADDALATRAARLGWHLSLHMRCAIGWIAAIIVVGLLGG
jgi:hypothetical protein